MLSQDLRYAIRMLAKRPVFTIIAVVTLALGIGANTAIFSVVNAVLLKPLPFPHPDQLVAIGSVNSTEASKDLKSVSFADFRDFRENTKSFQSLAVHRTTRLALTGMGEAQSLQGREVSGEFFDVLGVKPMLGRGFTRGEEIAGGGPNGFTVVLGHGCWTNQFKADPKIIGTQLVLNGKPHTIVGVMPKGFSFPIDTDPTDGYVTVAGNAAAGPDGGQPETEQRGNHTYQAVGRLIPGATAEQAGAELRKSPADWRNNIPIPILTSR